MTAEAILDLAGLQALLDALRDRGFSVLGPTVRDGAVVPAPITSVQQLPRGWGDEQDAAHYRMRRRDDDALFGYASGAQSWKPVLFPARQLLWRGRRGGDGFTVEPPVERTGGSYDVFGPPPYALIGVRSCDLHAIGIHDTVLLGRAGVDAHYDDARRDAFVVAVACSDPAGTCFCASMGTGPRPDAGFDLCLTELSTTGEHRLLVEAGSERGEEVLAALPRSAADDNDRRAAEQVTATATERMGRHLETEGLREAMYAGVESPHWDDVASRCLACGNCTLVCPTCFCTSVDDETDLTGDLAARVRNWDSCFTGDFSYLHGGSVRASIGSRYRQWATHKLASWIDQFGTSGCVGCGRCIAWCPAAIDITEEAAAVQAEARAGGS